MEDRKKHWGDRKDGYLIRDLDAMHYVMPHIYPNRCDNEAYISQRVDLTAINAYLAQKNELETEFPYTIFHLIVAAIIKTITLRPKMNRFIANKTMYQRKEVSAAFVVKKQFNDGSEEGLAFLHAKPEETLDTLHTQLKQQILACKDVNKRDSSSDGMDLFRCPASSLGSSSGWPASWTSTGMCPTASSPPTPITPRWCCLIWAPSSSRAAITI